MKEMQEIQITIRNEPYQVGVVRAGQSIPKARRALRDAYPSHTVIPCRIGGRMCNVEDAQEYEDEHILVHAELVKAGVDFINVIAVIEVCPKI